MSEEKVENVTKFLDKLTEIQKNKSDDTELFFRGHADKAYEAEPTIFRKNGNGERNLLKNEKHLFNDIITQCPEDFKDCQYTFEYLVKMQHYGLPTRLLDITSNALVALYFACCSLQGDKDGQVLVYAVRKDAIKNYNSDTVSVLSNLAQLDSDFEIFTKLQQEDLDNLFTCHKELIEIVNHKTYGIGIEKFRELLKVAQQKPSEIDEEYLEYLKDDEDTIKLIKVIIEIVKPDSKKEITRLSPYVLEKLSQDKKLKYHQGRFLHFIKQEKSYFVDNIDDEKDVQKIVCVQAKLNNQRIIRQNGLFFLFGMGKTKADPIKFSDYIKLEYEKSI